MTGTLQELAAGVARHGGRNAVGLRGAHGSRWWTYERLDSEILGFAALLRAHGVGRGDRVALWAPNGPEWVAAALATLLRGAVLVPVDADASPRHAARIVEHARPRLLLHGRGAETGALDAPCADLLAARPSPENGLLEPVEPGDPAFLLYTSGSTREPREVVLTHENLVCQADAFRRWRTLTRLREVRLLALSPLGHVQGLLMGMLVPLSLGLAVLYSGSVSPAHVIRTIRDCRISLLLAVPGVQGGLADALRATPSGRAGVPLGRRAAAIRFFPLRRHVLFMETRRQLGFSFSVLLVGGAPLPADDERFWYECGYVLAQGYGLTETSALVSVHVNGPFRARLGSVGRALAHQDVAIAADGEVLVRGPNVAARDGAYLRTGDLGRLDARGRLWLHGRRSGVIVTAEGLNVHVEDVEAALRAAAGVREAVVDRGEDGEVHAVLLLEPGAPAEAAVAAANASLEPYQRVRSWRVWPADDFPRTSLLKVRRAEVVSAPAGARETAAEEAPAVAGLAAIRAEGDRRRRLELLAEHVTRGDGNGGDGEAARVEELGLSSLDAVELVNLLEERAARPLPRLAVTPATSIGELRRSLAESRPRGGRPRLPARQPAWSGALPGRALRAAARPLLVGGWSHATVSVRRDGPRAWPARPFVLAVAPHRHWLDAFAVQAVLPRGTRTITATDRTFSEWFDPGPEVPRRARVAVGLAYHLLWPLVFEFAVVPRFGSTREGLRELGRALDRGLSPIAFPKGLAPPGEPNPRHDAGVAALAVETETPVVPVWLEGNDELHALPRRSRPHVTVRVGEAIDVAPGLDPGELVERVESAYAALAARKGGGRA